MSTKTSFCVHKDISGYVNMFIGKSSLFCIYTQLCSVQWHCFHQPMYKFLFITSIKDTFRATIIIPHVLRDLLLSNLEWCMHWLCLSGPLCSFARKCFSHYTHDHGLWPICGLLQPPALWGHHEQQGCSEPVGYSSNILIRESSCKIFFTFILQCK